MSSQKQQIDKGTYYSQLVNKTALQLVRDVLEKFGYNVEFIKVKSLDNKANYGKGLDYNLMRDKQFLEEVLANTEEVKKALVDKVKKTVVIAYNNTSMNLSDKTDSRFHTTRASKINTDIKYLVGYQYVSTETPTNEAGEIQDFSEVFDEGVQITEVIKPQEQPKNITIQDEYRVQEQEDKGYVLAKILKDMVYISFGVQMSLLTTSESELHNINFLLLRYLHSLPNSAEQTMVVDYTFDKATKPLSREVTYKVSELSGVESLGEVNSGMYNINFSLDNIRAELFSDYSYLRPLADNLPYKALLKLGIAPLSEI